MRSGDFYTPPVPLDEQVVDFPSGPHEPSGVTAPFSSAEAADALGISASTLRKKLASAKAEPSEPVEIRVGRRRLTARKVMRGRRGVWEVTVPSDGRSEETVRQLRTALIAPPTSASRWWWPFRRWSA